jgi:hypothetical protein
MYEHTFDFCFTVRSEKTADQVTAEELSQAINRRLENIAGRGILGLPIINDDEMIEACGLVDTVSDEADETDTVSDEAQFSREHGSLYDRGAADAYYGRSRDPHWYPQGSLRGEKISDLNEKEIEEYNKGYNECTDSKDWGE